MTHHPDDPPASETPAPEPQDDTVVLRGRLERGPHYADDFLIGKLFLDEPVELDGSNRKTVDVKGYCPDAMFGEIHELTGRWTRHARYGLQLEFDSWRVIVPTTADAIAGYLSKCVKWIGVPIAKRIVELYGDETLSVLIDEPDRVGREVAGLTEEKAHEVAAELRLVGEMLEARIEVQTLLAGHRVSNRTVEKILQQWGSQAPERIRQNPYALIRFDGIGFPTADAVAINRVGFPKDGEFRQLAAARYALQEIADRDGWTLADRMTVISRVQVLTGCRPSQTVIEHPGFDRFPAAEGTDASRDRMQLDRYARHEISIAERMRSLCHEDDWPAQTTTAGLAKDQIEGLQTIYSNSVSIVDGLPGTGKSFLVGRVVEALLDAFEPESILGLAPTGKAAKRLSELVPDSVECSTIHRALQWIPGEDEPMRGPDDPLRARFIIADEFSMADTELASFLLQAIAPGTRLLIVGDPHQLSPVRAGCVLRDFLRYGIARASLTEIKRNRGALVLGIHSVARGEEPRWPTRFSFSGHSHNLRFIHCGEDEIASTMMGIFRRMNYAGIDPAWDCQVMSPVNERGDFSRERLNAILAGELVPARREHEFCVGEKVIQTRNQKLKEGVDEVLVVNGDLGRVVDIQHTQTNSGRRSWYIVEHWWPDRTVRYPFGDHGLQPAYALTVHKMQGSSAPYVVIPLHRSQGTQVLSRNWIYTAMSRAERGCIFVGDIGMFDLALPRVETDWRKTRLVERMEEAQVARRATCGAEGETA